MRDQTTNMQLPGEEQIKARPLKPVGSKFATTDKAVALEIAQNLWQEAIYRGSNIKVKEITNIASLASAYLSHVDEYYIDENGNYINTCNWKNGRPVEISKIQVNQSR